MKLGWKEREFEESIYRHEYLRRDLAVCHAPGCGVEDLVVHLFEDADGNYWCRLHWSEE